MTLNGELCTTWTCDFGYSKAGDDPFCVGDGVDDWDLVMVACVETTVPVTGPWGLPLLVILLTLVAVGRLRRVRGAHARA